MALTDVGPGGTGAVKRTGPVEREGIGAGAGERTGTGVIAGTVERTLVDRTEGGVPETTGLGERRGAGPGGREMTVAGERTGIGG